MGGKKPLRRPLWPPTRATASNYYPLGLDGAGGAAKPLLRAPKKPAPLHGRLPAFSGAVDAFERARKCFLEWRYFFSIILSEFLKNRVALQAETAEYIAVYGGKKVTIVEMLPAICSDGEPVPTRLLLKSFKEHDVDVYTNASVSEITPDYVTFKYKGEEIRVKADTVVMATGIRPNDSLYNALKDAGYKVTKVGDSASGKNGLKNIREGFMAGLHI